MNSPDPQPHRLQGIALASAGAIAFSGKAIIVKLAYRYGVDAVTLLMYRMLFALPMFLGLSWWASLGRPGPARRDWWTLIALGFCGYYLASFLDFMGLQYISASLERLILYLNPTFVLVISVLLFKQHVSPRQWVALAVSYLGILVVFGHDMTMSGSNVAAAQGQILRLSRYRAARIGVDVNLHTGRWTFEQAVKYFMEGGGLDREAAEGEAAGAASNPSQKICYITGKWQIMRLLGRYRDAQGANFRLGAFHDQLISYGSLPLSVIEWLMFDDDTSIEAALK